jgi:hypothetical protein
MQRPETNPQDVQPEDILCDFCHRPTWSLNIASIEGHHGSVICVDCLKYAWIDVVDTETGIQLDGDTCTMCLEQRTDPAWRSPMHEEACICRRCIKLAAQAFRKDGNSGWVK